MSYKQIKFLNPFLPGEKGRHFADDIFECILMIEKLCILLRISLKFVPKGPIGSTSALVQVMAWYRTGEQSLPEPVLTQYNDAYV